MFILNIQFHLNMHRVILGLLIFYYSNLFAQEQRIVFENYSIEFLSSASLCMVHFSRISEEFVLWSSSEFGFIELPDSFATGSSIMPQKKNPDVPELVRGKTGRVFGSLIALLTIMKSLPLPPSS